MMHPRKVIVVGTTGSGKSTFARSLADRIQADYIQLDALYWKPGWKAASETEFFEKIADAIGGERWVVDGNYRRTNHITWNDADTVVWIDFPLWLTLWQVVSRSVLRALTGAELWAGTGNRESFSRLFSRDSIVLWLIKTYGSNVRRYEESMRNTDHSHVRFIRLRSRRAVAAFLGNLDRPKTGAPDQ